jgi:hypothetical protein
MRERAEAATPGEWHAFSSLHEDWYVASKTHGQVTTGIHDEPGALEMVLVALEGISGRLGAIERHLGLGETGTDGT